MNDDLPIRNPILRRRNAFVLDINDIWDNRNSPDVNKDMIYDYFFSSDISNLARTHLTPDRLAEVKRVRRTIAKFYKNMILNKRNKQILTMKEILSKKGVIVDMLEYISDFM